MSDFSMNVFAQRLKTLRQTSNTYQKIMASLLEISERQYRAYEAGQINPPTSKLYALADYFNVSLDYLVGRSDNPEINE